MLHIGFTGTQKGMTDFQRAMISRILEDIRPKANIVHQGCCIGADEEFTEIAKLLKYRIFGHPPTNTVKVSEKAVLACDVLYVPADYLDRNKEIVKACNILLAAPATKEEIVRSGTWSTIRFARKVNRETFIVHNDEEVKREHL